MYLARMYALFHENQTGEAAERMNGRPGFGTL